MIPFHETRLGKTFFEDQLPRLIRAAEKLAKLAEPVKINTGVLEENTKRVVVGYKYGDPPTLHSVLPLEGTFDVIVVFSDGSQEGYSYCDGKLIRDRC